MPRAQQKQPTNNQCHAFTQDVLATDDATAIAQKIATGELSALAVTEAAIARCQKVNPTLNAIVYECYDQALLTAQRPVVGEFSGVPTLFKDNVDIKGMPTGHGAKSVFTPKIIKKTDSLAKQILAQGFTTLGKTSLPAFGFSGTTEYDDGTATKNPWDLNRSAGGSSGGAAALVAAGAVPIAHGNDGGGSIRIPASACGLVGLKSSRGRLIVSNLAKLLPVNMIADGVLTRSVRDTANFFAAAESYYHNHKMPSIGRVTGANQQRLTIGLQTESITGTAIDDDHHNALVQTAELLQQLGHRIVPVVPPVPKDFVDAFMIYYGFMGFSSGLAGRFIFNRDFDKHKRDNLAKGLDDFYRKNFFKTPKAMLYYQQAKTLFKQAMAEVDLVLSPVTGYAAPVLGHLCPTNDYDTLIKRLIDYASFTALHNSLGTPAISLPLATTAQGLPLGMQFASRFGQEKMLLELAFELEEAKPFQHLYNS